MFNFKRATCGAAVMCAITMFGAPAVMGADNAQTNNPQPRNAQYAGRDVGNNNTTDRNARQYMHGTWVAISGTAEQVNDNSFKLDCGGGNTLTISTNGRDWYKNNRNKINGSKVTVYGRVNNGLFGQGNFNADSIYVENLGSYYSNNHSRSNYWGGTDVQTGQTQIRGTVSEVNDQNIVLGNGDNKITVDKSRVSGNGDKGIQKGDYIVATGTVRSDFQSNHTLRADSLTILRNDGQSRMNSSDRGYDRDRMNNRDRSDSDMNNNDMHMSGHRRDPGTNNNDNADNSRMNNNADTGSNMPKGAHSDHVGNSTPDNTQQNQNP